MIPHVLVVEDDEDFISEIEASISEASGHARVTVARGREEACALLDRDFFDLAILDLNIPTQRNGLDGNPAHGKHVFHHARSVTPGTKLLVLTGSPSEDFIADMLTHKHDADIWSEGGKVDTVEFVRKIDLVQVPTLIRKVLDAIQGLATIELGLSNVNLQTGEDRLVRIFAKKYGGLRCVVSPIGAGRSGALPLRLQLFNASGMLVQEVVAKLAPLKKVQDENARYDDHVVLLDPASTPRKIVMLEFGAGATAGLFYQLAKGYGEPIFATLGGGDARAARAVEAVMAALAQWSQGDAQVRRTVADIRRCWLDDARAAELRAAFGLGWAAEFEAMEIQMRWCCVHGDLHGGNVLVSGDGGSMVIDYGDVRHSAVSYDPVTLELSAVLQANPTLSDAWPDLNRCRSWNDIESYVVGSPIPMFVRACRSWADACAAGRREVAASAYSYLLRQLKYPDTDKDRILALMEGVKACMAAT